MSSFTAEYQAALQKKQAEVQRTASHEALSTIFANRQLPLQDLLQALSEAENQGLLDGFVLGDFTFFDRKVKPTTNPSFSKQERETAREEIVRILELAQSSLSKDEVLEQTNNPLITEKWSSLIRLLLKQGRVVSTGERGRTRYSIANVSTIHDETVPT